MLRHPAEFERQHGVTRWTGCQGQSAAAGRCTSCARSCQLSASSDGINQSCPRAARPQAPTPHAATHINYPSAEPQGRPEHRQSLLVMLLKAGPCHARADSEPLASYGRLRQHGSKRLSVPSVVSCSWHLVAARKQPIVIYICGEKQAVERFYAGKIAGSGGCCTKKTVSPAHAPVAREERERRVFSVG